MNMHGDPKVTVLMSVYNGERYLNEAIDSILGQTFTDFEFLIIDDASTDRTPEILRSYDDPRIRVVTNEENLGLTKSLNKGLALARGEYIARMDADDISIPERLEEQIEFMEHNPQVCVCGSWVEIIGHNAGETWKYPTDSNEIRCRHLFECSIAHPSAVIKKEYLNQNQPLYDITFKRSQDYDLWIRISALYPLANIGKVLLKHRIHSGAIGQHYSSEQKRCADRVRYRQLREFLGLTPTEDELRLHSSISSGGFEARGEYLNAVNQWLLKIWSANQERNYFDDSVLSAELAKRWYAACNKAANLGMITWEQFQASPLSKMNILTKRQRYTLLVKCLLKME
jgi:glycosyltransferase involved in cell wall biosynthesis